MSRAIRKTAVFIVIAYSFYLLSVAVKAEALTDLLTPVCDFLAAGVVFNSISNSENRQFRLDFICIGAALLCSGFRDTFWAVNDLVFHSAPAGALWVVAPYFVISLLFLLATVFYCVCRFRKWDVLRLGVDSVIFSVALICFLWIVLFDKQFGALGVLVKYNLLNAVYILMAFLQMLFIGVWYLSVRKGTIPHFLQVLAGSIFCYSFINLIYFYLFAKGIHQLDALLNALALGLLMCMAIAVKAYYFRYPSSSGVQEEPSSDIGYRHKGLLLIVFPVLIAMIKGPDLLDICFFAVLICLYEGFNNYAQAAISNQILLDRELEINDELGQLVAERTRDLESKNSELTQKNAELRYITDHDPLTGLYNRRYFLQQLEEAIVKIAPDRKLVLVIWNVDRLKGINNTYDYSTGDRILTILAGRVKNLQGNHALLARLGGDEFALAAVGNFENDEFVNVAKRIAAVCSEPIQIGEYVFRVTISAGVSLFPLRAPDARALFKNADVAMRHAKGMGPGNCISLYRDIDSAVRRKYLIGSLLKGAEYDREFSLHFQPQFRMADRRLVGMEALLRWDCPDLGPISPAEFVPIAEEEHLIIPIGNWVIENAIRQISVWNRSFHTDLRMGINISPKQLDQAGTLTMIDSSIRRHKTALDWIDIEITEGIALDNEDKATGIKTYFGNRGISLSIDDFGTGYSSLGYLNILSFDRLKIAKPLIDKITGDESSRKIVASIILLAKSLGLQTISEGVETEAQFDLLLSMGCDQVQGFFLGIPLPPESFQNTFLNCGDFRRSRSLASSNWRK